MTKPIFALIALGLSGLNANAELLPTPTAVHTQPNADAAVVKILASGTEPELAPPAIMAATPLGWLAVQVAGPFEGYVRNSDIDKGLRVKAGASIHLRPSANAGVLTVMSEGDKATITGLHGKWTQINFEKTVIGYIEGSSSAAAMSASPALVDTPAPAIPAPVVTAPTSTFTTPPTDTILPRLFQGTFASTRRPFTPRRPYDWQINDAAGVRYAYLDISKLLLTEQIEKYVEREVVIYGAPVALPDGKNIVIKVESLRLK